MAITKSMLETAIEAMPNDFDSHDVIRAVAQRNQRAYAQALNAIDGDLLFHKLHSALGQEIAEICDALGYTREQSRSDDIFLQKSRCIGWLKS
jgi:hypothetical protein